MFGFLKNGFRHVPYIYGFRSRAFSSTAFAISHTKIVVETLVNSLGFSTEEAISIGAKVSRSRPRNYNPDLVINFFEKAGLDNTQIKKVVSCVPLLLLCDVDKHLKHKTIVLQELGLSGSDLVNVITKNGIYFSSKVKSAMRPNVAYLRKVLGNDRFVAEVIKRAPSLLDYAVPELMPPNIALLQNVGFSSMDIEKFILFNPRMLVQKPEWLQGIVQRVEKGLGIPHESGMFFHGVYALSKLKESTEEMKLGIFRSFGWSDSDILTMVRKHPACLLSSEARLRNALNFLMKELGYEPPYLASRPAFFTYSLEKRVVPRHEILKLVNQKKVGKRSRNLYSVSVMPESKFFESCVLPFKEEMPEVYDLYIKSRN